MASLSCRQETFWPSHADLLLCGEERNGDLRPESRAARPRDTGGGTAMAPTASFTETHSEKVRTQGPRKKSLILNQDPVSVCLNWDL